jgi:hypothetical protein
VNRQQRQLFFLKKARFFKFEFWRQNPSKRFERTAFGGSDDRPIFWNGRDLGEQKGHHDTQHNDIQHIDIQHIDTQHK